MISIFDLKFESSEGLRRALGIDSCRWCEDFDIKNLIRMAFPSLTDSEIKVNLEYFQENGSFKKNPAHPKVIYDNYCSEFGCNRPFDMNGQVYEPRVETVIHRSGGENQATNELVELKKSLLQELNYIRNPANYTDADGKFNSEKADMLFRRAEKVNDLAGSITEIHKTEVETKKLQLEVVRTALSHGFDVRVNGNLLGVEIHEHQQN